MTNTTYGEQRTAAEKIVDENVKARVLRGLDALREAYGEDWVDYIDPELLSMRSATCCVLGQLARKHPQGLAEAAGIECPDYDEEVEALAEHVGADEEGDTFGQAYGFNTVAGMTYIDLDNAWLQVIGFEEA